MATTPPELPYQQINLRVNPFGSLDPEDLARVAAVDVETVVEVLGGTGPAEGAPARRIAYQLLGPPGCGKSTTLEVLRQRFPGAPLLAWSSETGWPAVPVGKDLLLVDDAQMMTGRVRRRVVRWRRLVIASQRDMGRALEGEGYETHSIWLPDAMSDERLREIVDRRLEWARRGSGAIPRIETMRLRELLVRYGPDLRAIVDDLYTMIQDHPPIARNGTGED